MAATKGHLSPVVQALARIERATTGEIRVHVSKRLFEKDPLGRARRLFTDYQMARTGQRNAVLVYINLRRRKFAIFADDGIHHHVGAQYWESLSRLLREDLQSTHVENALAICVVTIGATLAKFYPAEKGGPT